MAEKKRIKELIVVEGHHDTARLKQLYDCDTVETHGTCLSGWTLRLIKRAARSRGVIVMTDPDSPGNRIRKAVNDAVPGCMNAFVDKAHAHTTHKVGVEHADDKTIQDALDNLITFTEESHLTMQDMYALGLSGHPDSGERREKIGQLYHLGNGNAKTMLSRLNALGISKEELQEALK